MIADFTNTVNVEARDSFGTRVSDSDSARVEVENPNIQIVKSPPRQTLLKGKTASFDIFVINTSNTVTLTDVEVIDPLVPACNRQIGNLPKGGEFIYSCKLEDVDSAFTNEISVSARNIFTEEIVQDSSIASVEILGMHAGLFPVPVVVSSPGGSLQFVVDVDNDGSVPFRIQTIRVDPLGVINDPANTAVKNNSCLGAHQAELAAGQRYTCSFSAVAKGEPGPRLYDLLVASRDVDGNLVAASSEVEVVIADFTLLSISHEVEPASLFAPGGQISGSVRVTNKASAGSANLTLLHHSALGSLDGIGDCALPQVIAAGDSYTCGYEMAVFGAIGEVINQTISAAGTYGAGTVVGNVDRSQVTLFDPAHGISWLPLVVRNAVLSFEQDNDSPCAALPLIPGNSYYLVLDDRYNWFYFDVFRQGTTNVKIVNLAAPEVQVQVYETDTCRHLSLPDLVAGNRGERPNTTLTFTSRPGRHYLRIARPEAETTPIVYSMVISTP